MRIMSESIVTRVALVMPGGTRRGWGPGRSASGQVSGQLSGLRHEDEGSGAQPGLAPAALVVHVGAEVVAADTLAGEQLDHLEVGEDAGRQARVRVVEADLQ